MIKRHVSAAEIARFSEGDVSARKAARVRSHLAGCRRCASVREDLARVPALLASTEAPPMPEHLTARIQAALITESARRASHRAGPDTQPKRQAAGRSWPRVPGMSARAAGWAAAATAAVVVAGGGTYLIVAGQGSGGNSASSAAAPSGGAHRAAAAAGANAPTAPALRVAGPQLEYQRAGKATEFSPVATDKNYVPAKLAAQVKMTLADSRAPSPTAARPGTAAPLARPNLGTNASSGRSSRIGSFSVGTLEGCVSRVSAGARVLLVDLASYQSSPAAVIVTARTSQRPRQVWVVGAGCSASDSDVLKAATLPASG